MHDQTGGQQAGRKLLANGLDPNIGAGFRFKPGQSGNPKGRPKGKSLSTTIQEMMEDERFIERIVAKLEADGIDASSRDPDFQDVPMRAIISVAMLEAMNPNGNPKARANARDFLGRFGWGTKVDVTSGGERISESPKIISVINPRGDDASAQA